jgi:hypothetical protein
LKEDILEYYVKESGEGREWEGRGGEGSGRGEGVGGWGKDEKGKEVEERMATCWNLAVML